MPSLSQSHVHTPKTLLHDVTTLIIDAEISVVVSTREAEVAVTKVDLWMCKVLTSEVIALLVYMTRMVSLVFGEGAIHQTGRLVDGNKRVFHEAIRSRVV